MRACPSSRSRPRWSTYRREPIRFPTGCILQRPDCMAEHMRLELRNVAANYPFERSHRFRWSSRIPAAETIRVWAATVGEPSARIAAGCLRWQELPRFLPMPRWSGGGQSSNTIAHFALDFSRKESVCGFNLLRGARRDESAGHLYK